MEFDTISESVDLRALFNWVNQKKKKQKCVPFLLFPKRALNPLAVFQSNHCISIEKFQYNS